MSKSAQKNRRKKQQQQQQTKQQGMGGRSQEQRDAVSMATHLMGEVKVEGATGGGGGATEKKIKNLRKVIQDHFYVCSSGLNFL